MDHNKWQTVRLGDHADLLAGFTFKSKMFTDNPNDIHLVKGADVQQGYIDWDNCKRWSIEDSGNYDKFRLQENDVVLAMDRPWVPAGLKFGWIRKNDPPCLLVQRVARLRGQNGLSSRFLRFVIGSQSFTDYIEPIVTGVNVPHISGKQISDYQFKLPPSEIQQRIASILSAYDDLIENNTRRIVILEEMVRRIYQEWFVHFRFPGHEKVHLVDSELGMIPEGWDVLKFGEIASHCKRGIKPYEEPSTLYDHFSIPAFDAGALPAQELGESIRSSKYYLEDGCVLISKLNPRIQRVWLPDIRNLKVAIASTEFLVLVPKHDITRSFLYCLCRSEKLQGSYIGLSSGTSTSHQRVKPKDLMMMPVVLPSPQVRYLFNDAVEPLTELPNVLRYKNANLRQTRDLLLPKLISGEIDVSEMPEPKEAAA